jgi:hypothetical protein
MVEEVTSTFDKIIELRIFRSFIKLDLFIVMQQIFLVCIKWSSLHKSVSKFTPKMFYEIECRSYFFILFFFFVPLTDIFTLVQCHKTLRSLECMIMIYDRLLIFASMTSSLLHSQLKHLRFSFH